MGSKARIPSIHPRRPLPGHGMMQQEPFGPGMHAPPPGPYRFDMSPPPEVMEHKLATQHVEMERLSTENQRLAATHVTLRHELAAAQHELQMLQAQIGSVNAEREQQMEGLKDKISKMERELQASESIQLQLQQARKDAQSLVVSRQELFVKVQQMTQDLQRAHSDAQQVPVLISELENLNQEFYHCRATYESEKKSYSEHLELLKEMEKNYYNMEREVDKLRAELTNSVNTERRTGGSYGNAPVYNENEAGGHHPAAQNSYEDAYSVSQGRGAQPGGGGVGGGAPYGAGQPGSATGRPGYDNQRGSGYDAQRGQAYDAQRGQAYDAQRGQAYDAQRGQAYDAQRGQAYDAQRGSMYDAQRALYDAQRGYYDSQPNSASGPMYGHPPPAANVPYGSATPPPYAGNGYDATFRGRNPAQR